MRKKQKQQSNELAVLFFFRKAKVIKFLQDKQVKCRNVRSRNAVCKSSEILVLKQPQHS